MLVYSVPILHTILTLDDLRCWSHFVEACSLLLKPIVTIDDVIKGDEKLTAFCNAYEKLYGKNKCTPNMHLHLHLKDCMLDYGPLRGVKGYFNFLTRARQWYAARAYLNDVALFKYSNGR